MKKLMIAAVAVAAATVASADNYLVSEFTATVKTTKAKPGTPQPYAINLGIDGSGKFWYNDATNAWLKTQVAYTNKVLRGHTIDCFVKKNGAIVYNPDVATNATLKVAVNNALAYLGSTYVNKSAGVYCETVKYVDDAACFRVAGTEKCSCVFIQTNDCCVATSKAYVGWDWTNEIKDGAATDAVINYASGLLQRFGAQSPAKANKCEIFAQVENLPFGIRKMTNGVLAGQGVWDLRDEWVTSLAGNIVGLIEAPKCENCCWEPDPAVAWDCAETADATYSTAAYGSFRIKRNARLDFKK